MVKQFSNVFVEHILQAKYDLESQHNTMDINGASDTFSLFPLDVFEKLCRNSRLPGN